MKLLTPVFILSTLTFSTASIADSITAHVINRDGFPTGSATFSDADKGTRIVLNLKGLPPGEHALHFHDKGECLPPDFKTAGEHFSPEPRYHGYKVQGGPHAGDMKNIVIAKNGTLNIKIVNPDVTLQEGPHSLLKPGGTALIVHAKADDYMTQPSGGSGDRIACVIIKK